jgi:hypothetical protein
MTEATTTLTRAVSQIPEVDMRIDWQVERLLAATLGGSARCREQCQHEQDRRSPRLQSWNAR